MTNYADALINMAGSQMGYAEVNGSSKFGEWFGQNIVKKPGYKDAAWCDMFVSWAAHQTGQAQDVGQFSYTPEHAQWFKDQGAWGTKPVPGAVVFFDWGHSKNISAIDHVGLVKKVINDHTIQTIEGNISNMVVSKIRTDSTIVGYGYPEKIREKDQAKEKTIQLAAARKTAAETALSATAKQAKSADVNGMLTGAPETVTVRQPAAETTQSMTAQKVGAHDVDGMPAGAPEPLAAGALLLPVAVGLAAAKKSGGLRKLISHWVACGKR
ncbi:CHAP domain-containing protein [Herbidospora cretacea]|uniref:CHAP domain-containing protein n=1 Tax=Herbidospora cretacea TaxID=28444 RepID=UPI0007734346|nr:CHAP domain-containing protein [Herbidospora cretacea]